MANTTEQEAINRCYKLKKEATDLREWARQRDARAIEELTWWASKHGEIRPDQIWQNRQNGNFYRVAAIQAEPDFYHRGDDRHEFVRIHATMIPRNKANTDDLTNRRAIDLFTHTKAFTEDWLLIADPVEKEEA